MRFLVYRDADDSYLRRFPMEGVDKDPGEVKGFTRNPMLAEEFVSREEARKASIQYAENGIRIIQLFE